MRAWWILLAVACGGGAASHGDAPRGDAPADTAADAGLVQTMGAGDPTFGSDGVLTDDFGGGDFPGASVLLPSGRLLVPTSPPAGGANGSGVLVAFTSDGALDTSFGSAGMVALDQASDVLGALPDGSLMLATASSSFKTYERLHADGSLDATYGGTGHVVGGFDFGTGPVTLQNTDLIPTTADASGRVYLAAWQTDNHTVVSRLTASGRPDGTFGPYGTVQAGFGLPLLLAVEPDGSLWMAVAHDQHTLEFRHVLENGTVDPQEAGFLDNVDELPVCGAVIGADGSFAVAGSFQSATRTYVARFSSTGDPDTSYHGGILDVADGQCASFFANAVAARANGGIIVAAATVMAQTRQAAIVAVDGRGDHETTYAPAAFLWRSMFELADGKILAVGWSMSPQALVLARYLP